MKLLPVIVLSLAIGFATLGQENSASQGDHSQSPAKDQPDRETLRRIQDLQKSLSKYDEKTLIKLLGDVASTPPLGEELPVKAAAWSVDTIPLKPGEINVTMDFRNLSALQRLYSVRCTVEFSDRARPEREVKTFDLGSFGGGRVYVAEVKTNLKFARWKSVQVKANRLEANLRADLVASWKAPAYVPPDQTPGSAAATPQ
jgi:hypothetical protein